MTTVIPVTIRQPHGGALRAGGTPGNRGGRSYPDVVRQACLKSFAKRIPALRNIADDESLDPDTRLKAVDMLAKYGLGKAGPSMEVVRAKLSETLEIIRRDLPPEQSGPLIAALRAVWT